MKNLFKRAFVLGAIAGFMVLAGCDEAVDSVEDQKEENLAVPVNVTITVVDRLLTVTWDAVENAQGYEIITTSVGCGSGNRLINTKDITAYSYTETGGVGAASTLKSDKSNGAVAILAKNKIEIFLMQASGENQKTSKNAMASEVTAKVRALGGTSGDTEYLDSVFSSVTSLPNTSFTITD